MSTVAGKTYGDWRVVRPLGEGGQGRVYLAYHQRRLDMSAAAVALGRSAHHAAQVQQTGGDGWTVAAELQAALGTFERARRFEGHGAVKELHSALEPALKEKALERMSQEIKLYKEVQHPNLLVLLDENLAENWFVTAYQPGGTLESHGVPFVGKPAAALERFADIVRAVAALHAKGVVHRDIKPANIFVTVNGDLILGDAGLVFFADEKHTRLSATIENVGSRDWMPGWAQGMRLEDVRPSFDLFSLGKVLWSMVSGKAHLQFWYHRRERFDLEKQFPDDSAMPLINALLDRTVVEDEDQVGDKSAGDYLKEVEVTLTQIRTGATSLFSDTSKRPCRVCGRGTYGETHPQNAGFVNVSGIRAFVCNHCGNAQVFHTGTAAWKKRS